jgi:hypothetical protein
MATRDAASRVSLEREKAALHDEVHLQRAGAVASQRAMAGLQDDMVQVSLYLFIYLSIYLSTYLPIYLSIYLSTYLPINLCLRT